MRTERSITSGEYFGDFLIDTFSNEGASSILGAIQYLQHTFDASDEAVVNTWGYALHAPEVECISKGKARTPYGFGVKVSIATTLKEGLVVGMRSMPGNPYDGHTLAETLEQVGILTGTDRPPATAIVDKGYRDVEIEGVRILRSGQRCGLNPAEHLWKALREGCFASHVFADLDAVEAALVDGLAALEEDTQRTLALTGFRWIISISMNAIY